MSTLSPHNSKNNVGALSMPHASFMIPDRYPVYPVVITIRRVPEPHVPPKLEGNGSSEDKSGCQGKNRRGKTRAGVRRMVQYITPTPYLLLLTNIDSCEGGE